MTDLVLKQLKADGRLGESAFKIFTFVAEFAVKNGVSSSINGDCKISPIFWDAKKEQIYATNVEYSYSESGYQAL